MASKKALKNRLVAKVVDGESGPCAFCRQTNNDEVAFGKLYSIGDLYCHYFCVLLSCCLVQKGPDEQGLLGFLYTDIQAELERSKKHKCSYCGQEGATLGCSVSQCRKQFHMPCGRRKQAVSLFFGNYKSFCSKHAPRQKIDGHILEKMKLRMQRASKKAAKRVVIDIISDGESGIPTEDEDADVCVICYEPVEPVISAQTFWPPCCARDARFHRHCLERMALSAGIHYLKCPLCNDKDNFYRAVVAQGYYVPDRDAAWELEQNAFADIYDRDITCNAEECKCPMGRAHDTDNGAWDIKLCLLCGSCGVHTDCLPVQTSRYICTACMPAAPDNLEELEAKIMQIQEEQQRATRAAQESQPRRVMPSRMSLRSTKGAVVSTSRNWRSQATVAVATQSNMTDEDKEDQSNTTASRSQLNLKTPKRHSRYWPRPAAESPLHVADDDTLVSPLKYLQERLRAARATVDAERVTEKLRGRFKKPRPLSMKRKIVNAIFNEILNEGPKVRSPLKEWNSPKKLESTPKKKQKPFADTKSPSLKSPEHVKTKTITPSPKTDKSTPNRTPVKAPLAKLADETLDLDKASEHHDESSNSTFQLPSEFVAEHISDDDLPVFETPKKCTTVEIEKDSSMEISNEEAKINIDLIKIDSEKEATEVLKDVYVKSPERTVKCSYKFSPTDKEVLETADVGIDVESFKNRYLNEVVKDFKSCAYSHKHDSKEALGNRLKTPIDFAVEAVKRKVLEASENSVKSETEEQNFIGFDTENTENSKKRRKSDTKLGLVKSENHDSVPGSQKRTKRDRKKDYKLKKGMKRNKKSKPSYRNDSERKGMSTHETDEEIIICDDDYDDISCLKRKIDEANYDIGLANLRETTRDSVASVKRPKLDFSLRATKKKCPKASEKQFDSEANVDAKNESEQTLEKTSTDYGVIKISDNSEDDFEHKRKPSKELNKKSKSREERRLRKLNKKQRKNKKYLLKCKKSRSSVKIKLVYNKSDATDENFIDLTVKSKKETKIKKHKRSMSDKEINLKIKFKSEHKKHKKSTLSPNTLKQTVLNFSPDNVSKNCLMKPKQELAMVKKRINHKKELSTDSLKQTSIQNFFNKIISPVKEEPMYSE